MGYWKKKLEVEKKYAILKRVFVGILLFIIACLGVFSVFLPPQTWKYYVALPKISARIAGEMRIHFLDVGQGDCSLIELPDGKVMMIDGGPNNATSEKRILRYLNALKIKTIDYLVVTHADEDHCGGLDAVLEHKKVLNAYLPPSFPDGEDAYAQFYAKLIKEQCDYLYASPAAIFEKPESYPYTLTFLYPYTMDVEGILASGTGVTEEQTNEYGSVLWLDYNGVSALFTGDAPASVESVLLRDGKKGYLDFFGVTLESTEILKVAHHGSADSSSVEFLSYLGIETAVISCGENNVYGHPTPTVLTNLQSCGAKEIFCTDLHGNVMITVSRDGTYKTKTI